MELALNLGWALVTVWMVCAWLRIAPRAAKERRAQLVALAVVILILLPAISMTDDLVAAQNPVETDSCVRRDHDSLHPHSIAPLTAIPQPTFAALPTGFEQSTAPAQLPAQVLQNLAFPAIQNRPPPAA
jgi:hypothetical protein